MNNKITNVKYELINSCYNGYKEVRVTFLLNEKASAYFVFVKEGEGVNYLKEAKKIFDNDLKNGKVEKTVSHHTHKEIGRPAFAAVSILAAATLALGGLLTWKLLTPNVTPGGGGGDTPVVDETVSSFTYSYSPYFDESAGKVAIYFADSDESNEEEPPFTGDVYVQWDAGDPTTKEKVIEGTKKVTHTYHSSNPRLYNVIISGDVKRFDLTPDSPLHEWGEEGNNYITSINFGQSVKTIRKDAFSYLIELNNVNIAGQVNKIENLAFLGCENLVGVEFSRFNETDRLDIANLVFMGCNKLRYIHFPKRLSYVGPFSQCTNLEEITIPAENPYFSATYKDGDGKDCSAGMLVTKKDVKAPEDCTDYEKDGVVAATKNLELYDGIKTIYSLSGVDLGTLRIPKSVENIYVDELITSSIDKFYVEPGNTHYTDLYQESEYDLITWEPYTANLLAEVKEDGLSIIKLGNKLIDRIPEYGVYFDGEDEKRLPVTEFAYGAADNAKITSLDLPSTIKKVDFGDRLMLGWLSNHHINPINSTLTDLTIRSINPPECTNKDYIMSPEYSLLRDVIGKIGETREKMLNVHIPEESIEKYEFDMNSKDPTLTGFWNFSNIEQLQDPQDPNIFFRYTTIDSSLILTTRDEAREWVKENYTLRNKLEMFIYSKWDLAGLKQLKDLDQSAFERFKKQLDKISAEYPLPDNISWYNGEVIASCFPAPSQGFSKISVAPLDQDSFNTYFNNLNMKKEAGDYVFSVKNGCLEAVQTPTALNFFQTEKFNCHVKHTVKFDNNGYPIVNRFDFTNIVYNENPIDDIFLEKDYRSLSCNIDEAKIWAEQRETNTDKVVSRSMNYTIAYRKPNFEYDNITPDSDDYNAISGYIKGLAGGEMSTGDLISEEAEYVYRNPQPINAILANDITDGMTLGFSNDGHLCIAQAIDAQSLSPNFDGDKIGRIYRFNDKGICDYMAIYFNANFVQSGTRNPFCGYIEITNHLESEII